jgi:muramoyltetrapeptide carboxypeptidase
MPVNFDQNTPESLESVFAGLEGRLGPIDTRGTVILNPGRARGRLLGGNLSILQSLLGSPDALPDAPFILVAEDVGEYLYHLERLFFSLQRAGVLGRITGFLGGTFSDMRDNTKAFGQAVDNPFGKTALEIVRERIEPLGIPACVGYQAGHCDDNRALVLGAETEISF